MLHTFFLNAVAVFAFATVGNSSYGSSGYSIQCLAGQGPWPASSVSSGFYDAYGNPVAASSRGGPVSVDILQDAYSAANFTYAYNSRLTFDHPLTLSDGGNYTCNVSVQLTYPDNSTVVLTNSSSFSIFVLGELTACPRTYCLLPAL